MSVDLSAIREAGQSVNWIDRRILAVANRLFNRRLENLKLGANVLNLEWLIENGGSPLAITGASPLRREFSFDFSVTVTGLTMLTNPVKAGGNVSVQLWQYPFATYPAGRVAITVAGSYPAIVNGWSYRADPPTVASWQNRVLAAGDVLEILITLGNVTDFVSIVPKLVRAV